MRRASLLAVVALAFGACGAQAPEAAAPKPARTVKAAAAAPPAERNPPVVVLTFDMLSFAALLDSRQRIDPVLYPNLSKLARGADVYANYTTPSDETTSLLASLLASRRYDPRAKPRYRDLPDNMFSRFSRAGYALKVREAASSMCPPKRCPGNRPPQSARDVLRQLASGRIERFRRWYGLIDSVKRPTLWWTHFMLPHGPQVYNPSGRRYNPLNREEIPGLNAEPTFGDPWLVRQGWQRYLMQLRLTDTLAGELIARMKRQGVYDRALLVLTGDHGAGYGYVSSHPHKIDSSSAADVASTTLIVKRPRQRAGRWIGRHVRLYDLFPGVARLAGVNPGRTYGRSFAGAEAAKIPSAVVTRDRKGKVRRWSLARYRRLVRAAVARRIRAFGEGTDALERLYRQGPRPELIGRRTSELAPGTAAGARWKPTAPGRFAAVKPSSAFVPTHVVATIAGASRGAPFALAINGTIAGTGRVARSRSSKRLWISSVVPESALSAGRNRLELFLIAPGGGLRRVPAA